MSWGSETGRRRGFGTVAHRVILTFVQLLKQVFAMYPGKLDFLKC